MKIIQFALLTTVCAALGHASIVYTVNDGLGHQAEAVFTFGLNSLQLQLANTNGNIQDAGQLLTAFDFTPSSGTGISFLSSSADHITVAANQSFTDNGVSATGWSFTAGSPDHLEFAHPNTGIIGTAGGGGTYSNANNSIAGNGPHNPLLAGIVTYNFVFASGVDPNTTLSSAPVFWFNTDVNFSLTGSACTGGCGPITTQGEVPEPVSVSLVGGGLLALGFLRRCFAAYRAATKGSGRLRDL